MSADQTPRVAQRRANAARIASELARCAPLAGLLLFVAGLCLQPMQESDLFFRVLVGRQVLDTGSLPMRNLFSFTYPDHPDLDSAWLFDVAAAALVAGGGFPAAVLGKTALVAAIFAAAYWLARRRGAHPIAAAAGLAIAAACMQERLVERPHVFSFAGEIALFAALLAWRNHRRLWLAVPLTALWANLHAGAFVAPLLLATMALGQMIETRRSGAGLRALGVAAACGAALLATPVGDGILRYLAAHAGLFAIHPVDEFRPPSWQSDAPVLLFAAAAAILFITDRDRRWPDILPLLALAALAATSVRFAADLVLAAAPLAAARISRIADAVVAAAPPAALSRRLREHAGAAAIVTGALLAALAIGPRATAAARAGTPLVSLDLDPDALPLDAIRFVEDNGLRERMYNDFETGSYLAWQGYPRYRVFVDPRLPAYPLSFHRLLGQAHPTRAEWDATLARHRVDSALVGHAGINHRIGLWDPARWALVYREKDARVFVRRLPRFRHLIADREIPATFSFTIASGAETLPLPHPPPGSPVRDCEWQRRLGDLYFDLDAGRLGRALPAYRQALSAPAGCLRREHEAATAAWLGSIEAGRHHPALALAALDRALALVPDDVAIVTQRALALEALGRRDEARDAWVRIAALVPGTALAARAQARQAALDGGR